MNHRFGVCKIVESVEELPSMVGVSVVYADVETNGLYPYLGHRVCGIAVLRDDEECAYYVPIRHKSHRWNLPMDAVLKWMQDVAAVPKWVNHNVKFDAHFFAQDGALFQGELIDTVVLSKIYDSDKMSHKLEDLVSDYLGVRLDKDRIARYCKNLGQKKDELDYSAVPADMLGEYACIDVLATRELYRFLKRNLHEELNRTIELEHKLTPVLFDMERAGLLVDPLELKVESVKTLQSMIASSTELCSLAGREFTNSNQCIYDILVNQLQLPVLAWNDTDEGEEPGACFDKDALKLYSIHPKVLQDPKTARIIELIQLYRTEAQFKSLFLESYEFYKDRANKLHPSYNQIVRTGRMSCKEPNFQQLNKRAKKLIHPEPGKVFLSCDASQIEFRLIVHYIEDVDAIRAYNENPDTDFHQFMADLCGVKRKQAKNMNFAVGYGAGKKKVLSMLMSDPDIMEDVSRKAIETGRDYAELCEEHANFIYHGYHERMPGIKRTAYEAQRACEHRGFVFNLIGRRRHLPRKHARKAFNTVVQGSAMDLIKYKMVELSPRYNARLREARIDLLINVHDELVWSGSPAAIQAHHAYIGERLCEPPVPLLVPLRWSSGVSEKNWAEA